MSDENECEYCKKPFMSKSSLNHHKKTAKYCISKQGIINDQFTCQYCDKKLSSKERLNRHIEICKTKEKKEATKEDIEIILKQKDEYIAKIEAMLEKANQTIADIAKQPTTTTNNTINNDNKILSMNFDIEDFNIIKQTLETHLTPSVLKQGQEGLADMLNSKLLRSPDGTPLYECTDVSRKNFEFRNRNGDIEIDPQANRLIRNLERSDISKIAGEKSEEIWTNEDGTIDSERQNFYMPRVVEVMTIESDSTKLRSRLANLTARQKRVKK